jgi:hypothetical protein
LRPQYEYRYLCSCQPSPFFQEIAQMNTEEFKWGVNWQQVLKSLIEDHQDVQGEEARQVRHFFLLPLRSKYRVELYYGECTCPLSWSVHLKVWWHAATLFDLFYINRAVIQYLYICTTRKVPLLLSSLHPLGRGLLQGLPSRDSNSGMPCSKPMRYSRCCCCRLSSDDPGRIS